MMAKPWQTLNPSQLSLLLSMVFYVHSVILICQPLGISYTLTLLVSYASMPCCFFIVCKFLTMEESFGNFFWNHSLFVSAILSSVCNLNGEDLWLGKFLFFIGALVLLVYTVYTWYYCRQRSGSSEKIGVLVEISYSFMANGIALIGRWFVPREKLSGLMIGAGVMFSIGQASNDDQGRLFLAWGDGHFQDTKDTSPKLRANKISNIQGLQDERRKVMEGIQDLVGDNHDIDMSMIDGTNISDAEWFYMLSLTRSFSAAEGIPGKSLTTGSLVWLTDARELQFYNCERAKETQLNGIETMVCIPTSCSVLELGSSEIIKENWGLVQQVKYLFESDLNGMLQKQSTPNFSNTCSPPTFSLS
ncbi:Rho GTPase activating protein with PAK-box/P21-Rho-binding domain [Hibiscus syriacus]|uniref:Transcription factor n=1 Tax=Hibiscus syriacus TaxID=106335 RepID=A0A6A3BD51_HIBSY|nr:Rho GTPase activating protein with PAK-box/P21-Rho-binding domain [Hibiscus syriacus]